MISTKTSKKAQNKHECYALLCTGRVLTLTLKKKWFDMIAKGIKKEEYREIKDYWINRLTEDKSICQMGNSDFVVNDRKFDKVLFKNGYSKDAPTMIVECKGIETTTGKTEWGAEEGEHYFVIRLGKILFNNALM
tara:strand:- start:32857 stop:33261 length:405 start_codon:yes stop_codon:yes gene_type:complete